MTQKTDFSALKDYMKTIVTIVISWFLVTASARAADDSEMQVSSLFDIFSSMCVKHIGEMDKLRNALRDRQKLSNEKTSALLNGIPGSAWQIPDKSGSFVLALHESKAFCTVFGERVKASVIERWFEDLFSQAPEPMTSVRTRDERVETKERGPVHIISYSWSTPDAQKKLLFTLSTAPQAKHQVIINVLALK